MAVVAWDPVLKNGLPSAMKTAISFMKQERKYMKLRLDLDHSPRSPGFCNQRTGYPTQKPEPLLEQNRKGVL